MRIAILTLPLHTNYGGILQAFALTEVLKHRQHDVRIIDWYSIPHYILNGSEHHKNKIEKYLLGRLLITIKGIPYLFSTYKPRHFIDTHFKKHYINEWTSDSVKEFDVVIVGSDQVWRPKYNVDTLMHNFCDFFSSKDAVKIAYSASIGTDKCEYDLDQIKEITRLLSDFKSISVREDSGVNLCRSLFNTDAKHLLDPTLLLDRSDYMRLAGINKSDLPMGGLMTYILDDNEEIRKFIEHVSIDRQFDIRYSSFSHKYNGLHTMLYRKESVERWIKAFFNADFIITDSFHACIFSIIFGKPFIVLGNESRGLSRIKSLLAQFDCMDHLIQDYSSYDSKKRYDICESEVEEQLSIWRSYTTAFFDNNGL